MGYIYLIYNTVNTKIYIGQTTNSIEYRTASHFSKSCHNEDLKRDIDKYGREAFEIYKLAECDNNKIGEMEKYYIQLYDSFNCGYNKSEGGEGSPIRIYDENKVIKLYANGESMVEIQKITGYNWNTIKYIIDKHTNVDIENIRIKNKKHKTVSGKVALVMIDNSMNGIERIFESKIEAYNFIKEELGREISKENFYARVGIACETNRICYGHRWRLNSNIDIVLEELNNYKKANIDRHELNRVGIPQKEKKERPDKETLEELLLVSSYEEIGRLYNVSGKAVRKWCDKYNIAKETYIAKKPDKETLEELLSRYSAKEIADMFEVTHSTVNWWKRDLGIAEKRGSKIIICENTGMEFTTYKDAAKHMKTLYNYSMSDKELGKVISKSIINNKDIHGIKWSIKDKQV